MPGHDGSGRMQDKDTLCGPCARLDIHGAVEHLLSQDSQLSDSFPLESPWHSTLGEVDASSSSCALCSIVMKGWQASREVVVEQALLDAMFDPSHPPPGLNDPVRQIAAYRDAPVTTLEVERLIRTVADGRTNNSRLFLRVESGQEEQTSFDVLDSVVAELRIVRENQGLVVEDAAGAASAETARQIDLLVHANPLSQESLQVARGWLETCVNRHGEACGPPAGAERWLPTRLLEVELASGKIYLRESPILEPSGDARYVALSHCWGQGGTPFTTTHPTLRLRMDGIDIDTLPQTFQDSVTLTDSLGLRYLWIDSLCIIQDDANDWAREAAQMANVYRNAHLVLNAANSAADSTGFLRRPRHPPDTVRFPSPPSSPGGGTHHHPPLRLQLLPPPTRRWEHPSGPDPLATEPISARAWCLQERALPARALHYGTHQAFWECERLRASEAGDAVPQTGGGGGGGHLQRLCRTAATTTTTTTTTTHSVFFSRPPEEEEEEEEEEGREPEQQRAPRWADWHRMVEDYTARRITKHTDRLPALSGLAQAVVREASAGGGGGGGGEDQYLAGLWKTGLLEGLLWRRARPGRALAPTPEYVAPSWSWVAVTGGGDGDGGGGGVQFPVYTWHARRAQWKARMADFEALAEYVGHGLVARDGDPYGRLEKGGWLAIRAPLLEVVAVRERQGRAPELRAVFGQPPGRSEVGDVVVGMREGGGSRIWVEGGFDCPGVAADAAGLSLFVVLLTRLPHVLEEGFVEHRFGLILERLDGGVRYRRVGFIDGVVLEKSILDAVRGRGMFSIVGYPRPYKEDDTYEVVRHNDLASDPLMLAKVEVTIC